MRKSINFGTIQPPASSCSCSVMSGIFAYDRAGEGKSSYNDGEGRGFEDRGERSWRGGDQGGSRGYRGRGRGRGRGGGGRGRGRGGGGGWQNRTEEDDEGDVRMEGKRWSEKGGLRKTYERGGIFSRLGARGSGGEEGGGRGRGVFGRLNWSGSSMDQNNSEWHKVTIPGGGNMDQDSLIQTIQSGMDATLRPVSIHTIKDKLMFFLDNHRAVSQMKRLGRVDLDNGSSLPLIIKRSAPPRTMNRGGGGGRGGSDRDRDGDQQMDMPSDRGRGRGGTWGRGRPWERGGRGGTWERGGRGGRRDGGAARFDGDINMSQDTTTVLLACLGQRYDVNTKSLDLSSMYHDPSLKENGVRGCMYNKEFVSSILELVGANCPELLSLDLSSNRLQHLDAYSTLTSVCPSLQSINLSDNELHSPSELEKLAGMASLTKLAVEGNPFTQGGSDLMSLANTLRKIFPNIQTLDGQDLPSPAKFDLPTSVGQLPPTQKGFVVNDQIQTLVVEFVQQYYSLYDGENRDKLFEAYSEDAVFSLSVNGTRRGPPMDMYMPFSHNLARLKDPGKRQSLVKHGRIDIVQCLRSLPRSKNHLSAFNVDVMRATQNSTAFVIYGFFSEVGGSRIDNVPVRAFTRTFVLTAVGSGIAITNDQMTLRQASHEQIQIAHEELASLQQQSAVSSQPPLQESPIQQQPALQQQSILQQNPALPSTSALPQPPTGAAAGSGAATGVPFQPHSSFPNPQDEAIMRIAQTTSMSLEWSKKCLMENEWDFNKAVTAFTLLNAQGKIPREAFQ